MQVTLERSALLKALGHVHRVVERRTTIPILSNVLVGAEGKSLLLKATDLDLEVTEKLPADVNQAGVTTLPAHILYDIVRKLPEGAQVSLESGKDASQLVLDQTDTDQGQPVLGEIWTADEAVIHAQLSLASEVVVHTRENHNQLVARVSRLVDKPQVVGGLARLDFSYDKTPSIPGTLPQRIFKSGKDRVGYFLKTIDTSRRQIALKVRPVPVPVAPADLRLPFREPRHVTLLVNKDAHLADPCVELAFQLAGNLFNLSVIQPVSVHLLGHEGTAGLHLLPDRVRGHIARGQGNEELAGHLLGHLVGDAHVATPRSCEH